MNEYYKTLVVQRNNIQEEIDFLEKKAIRDSGFEVGNIVYMNHDKRILGMIVGLNVIDGEIKTKLNRVNMETMEKLIYFHDSETLKYPDFLVNVYDFTLYEF